MTDKQIILDHKKLTAAGPNALISMHSALTELLDEYKKHCVRLDDLSPDERKRLFHIERIFCTIFKTFPDKMHEVFGDLCSNFFNVKYRFRHTAMHTAGEFDVASSHTANWIGTAR